MESLGRYWGDWRRVGWGVEINAKHKDLRASRNIQSISKCWFVLLRWHTVLLNHYLLSFPVGHHLNPTAVQTGGVLLDYPTLPKCFFQFEAFVLSTCAQDTGSPRSCCHSTCHTLGKPSRMWRLLFTHAPAVTTPLTGRMCQSAAGASPPPLSLLGSTGHSSPSPARGQLQTHLGTS